jgi:EAL domain-containing protein (putative c-di-GMP-specific phosphodiesterase class I)
MRAYRRAAFRTLVVVIATAVFTAAGYVGGEALIGSQNRAQLENLSASILRRAEVEADFAFVGLSELVESGMTGCHADALAAMRRQVFARSAIKDIRIVDAAGATLCAAFPDMLDPAAETVSPTEVIPARNPSAGLARLTQGSSTSLGVLWRALPEASLLAIVNTDALLFGVLPGPLASEAQLDLCLTGGDPVASFTAGKAGDAAFGQRAARFTHASSRYPLEMWIAVDGAALAQWNRGLLPYYWGPAALLGVAFGALLAWLVVPKRTLLAEIDEALAAGEIVPFVQPVVSLESGEVVGCEILARWLRKDGSIVPPQRFIPQIEQSGRARVLTWNLLGRALYEMQDALRTRPSFTVAVNIVPSHLLEPNFVTELQELVAQGGASPRQIILEVTERQELPDLEHASKVVSELAEAGFAVAIDDAGTGHSGLSYVQSLGARLLKLDKYFIDALETSHSARVVVEMLVGTAKRLNMNLVAEGIERQSQLAWLGEIGVEHGQGYLFGRPVPIASLLSDLERSGQKRSIERPPQSEAAA